MIFRVKKLHVKELDEILTKAFEVEKAATQKVKSEKSKSKK